MTDEVGAGYVVLQKQPHDDGQILWEEICRVEASTPQAAIKEATDGEGVFVAVPARSFKPISRKRQQITKDVWA